MVVHPPFSLFPLEAVYEAAGEDPTYGLTPTWSCFSMLKLCRKLPEKILWPNSYLELFLNVETVQEAAGEDPMA